MKRHWLWLITMFIGIGLVIGGFPTVYAQEKKGRNTGLHEGILGSGGVLGAFFGGLVAGRFGLKAPYVLCFGLMGCAMLAEWIISAMNNEE